MKQNITGYYRDSEGEWVAELACGHCQHVRHQPPWISRPWVLSEPGRKSMVGQPLLCRYCVQHRAAKGQHSSMPLC